MAKNPFFVDPRVAMNVAIWLVGQRHQTALQSPAKQGQSNSELMQRSSIARSRWWNIRASIEDIREATSRRAKVKHRVGERGLGSASRVAPPLGSLTRSEPAFLPQSESFIHNFCKSCSQKNCIILLPMQ